MPTAANTKYLVIHTSATGGHPSKVTAEAIKRYHVNVRGWRDVGYHYLIDYEGVVTKGRPDMVNGAHARGINAKSLGICVLGHGDKYDFSEAQYEALYTLLRKLQKKYNVPTKNVIGHRELYVLVERGELAQRFVTNKSCPGKKISMINIRSQLARSTVSVRPTPAPVEPKPERTGHPVTGSILTLLDHYKDEIANDLPAASENLMNLLKIAKKENFI